MIYLADQSFLLIHRTDLSNSIGKFFYFLRASELATNPSNIKKIICVFLISV